VPRLDHHRIPVPPRPRERTLVVMNPASPVIAVLSQLPVLAEASPARLRELAETAVVLEPGQSCSTVEPLVIVAGQAEVTLRGAPLGVLGEGEILVPERLPDASVVTAVTRLQVVRLSGADELKGA